MSRVNPHRAPGLASNRERLMTIQRRGSLSCEALQKQVCGRVRTTRLSRRLHLCLGFLLAAFIIAAVWGLARAGAPLPPIWELLIVGLNALLILAWGAFGPRVDRKIDR